MPRYVGIAAAALLVSAISWSLRAVFGNGELSGSAATLVGSGVMLLTVVAMVGLLLVRPRWARYLGIGLLFTELALLPGLERDAATIIVAAVIGISLVLVAGPWLPRSLRHHPAANGPPLPAVILLIGLLSTPILAGLAAPSGVAAGHLILAGSGPLLAWWLGRAHASGLWATRLGLPIAATAGAAASPALGAVAIAAVAIALVVLAWRKEVRMAVSPLAPLPGGTYRIPPELAPVDVLEAAGLDERGRPKE